MHQQHKAFFTLHGREVSGYTIQVLDAGDWGVSGELTKPSCRSIAFTIRASEYKFESIPTLHDIMQTFGKTIQETAVMPVPDTQSVNLEY